MSWLWCYRVRGIARSVRRPRVRSELGTLWRWGRVSILEMYNEMCTRRLWVFPGLRTSLRSGAWKVSMPTWMSQRMPLSRVWVWVAGDYSNFYWNYHHARLYDHKPWLWVSFNCQLKEHELTFAYCFGVYKFYLRDIFEHLFDPLILIWTENTIQIFTSSLARTPRLTDRVQFCGTTKSTFSVVIKSTTK